MTDYGKENVLLGVFFFLLSVATSHALKGTSSHLQNEVGMFISFTITWQILKLINFQNVAVYYTAYCLYMVSLQVRTWVNNSENQNDII